MNEHDVTEILVQPKELRKQRYRRIRIDRNLSMEDMAQSIGVDRTTWWWWEKRGRMPSYEHLAVLKKETGEAYSWLRGED
jgi:transcriptional regulator with XRE-family HTH domain